jgi:hypothetical protein
MSRQPVSTTPTNELQSILDGYHESAKQGVFYYDAFFRRCHKELVNRKIILEASNVSL